MEAALKLETGYRQASMELEKDTTASLLMRKDPAAFEQVFKQYYKNLHAYAFTMLKDNDQAEEMVQQVFFKLWDRSENLNLTGSIQAYLYKAVYHECLNYIKHQKVRSDHQLRVAYSLKNQSDNAAKKVISKELEARLRSALNELPEQCRTIFQMSRFEELKYKEIADRLNISIKTVENQMGKALKILRTNLADCLTIFLILILPS